MTPVWGLFQNPREGFQGVSRQGRGLNTAQIGLTPTEPPWTHGSQEEVCLPDLPSRASLGAQMVKNLPASAGDAGSIPGWGRSPGEGNGNPLQCSCLENPTDRGAWQGRKESDTTERLTLLPFSLSSPSPTPHSHTIPLFFPLCPE